jgi:hypothetical protein
LSKKRQSSYYDSFNYYISISCKNIPLKKVPIILLLLQSFVSFAQNYQCVQAGIERYYTGAYLRGIKIDSIRVVNNETILYPFRSPRGSYQTGSQYNQLNNNGGSWLGKEIRILNNGVTLFDNLWGDTIVIKTNAQPGESWIFYDDNSGGYYTATVSSIDSMTVLSTIDEVKTITITAYNYNGSINAMDIFNNEKIQLSRNHGFLALFSIYTFPLHPANLSSYTPGLDYLMDKGDIRNNKPIIYKLSEFKNPSKFDIYNYQPGDIFEHHVADHGEFWTIDTIINKQVGAGIITYQINEGSKNLREEHGEKYYYYAKSNSTLSIPEGTLSLIDGELMPEQSGNTNFFSYDPFDSSHCITSPAYGYEKNFIENNGNLDLSDSCKSFAKWKAGFGLIHFQSCSGQIIENTNQDLLFSKKNGIICGEYNSVSGINEIQAGNNGLAVYPNPASEIVYIVCTLSGFNYSISDLSGKIIKSGKAAGKNNVLNIESLANGVYLLNVVNSSARYSTRLFISH